MYSVLLSLESYMNKIIYIQNDLFTELICKNNIHCTGIYIYSKLIIIRKMSER